MRFMMLIIQKRDVDAPPGTVPEAEMFAAMSKYNDSLRKAGILLAVDGLHPPSMGTRVSFLGKKASITDGPFSEVKEILGGYWMLEVRSKEEAVEWAKRCPAAEGDVLEVRQVHELSDFPPELRKAGGF
jgi:hypothetical protein